LHQIVEEAPNHVGLAIFAALFAQEERLLHGAFGFAPFAEAHMKIAEHHPASGIALDERTSFTQGQRRAAKLALTPKTPGTARQDFGALMGARDADL
jgi:hypothetical protein